MTPLFKKLNYKDQKVIFIQNPPEEFSREMSSMSAFCPVETQFPTKERNISFILIFVTRLEEIEQSIQKVYPMLEGDAVLWFAYPKGTSKKYRCEFNRDTGWKSLGSYNLEPVRQVAVDEDWSALRFRKVEFIKNFTRNDAMILSEKGREKRKDRSGL
jgi:hypothetical protein